MSVAKPGRHGTGQHKATNDVLLTTAESRQAADRLPPVSDDPVLIALHHRQLDDLRFAWDTAYAISQPDADTWAASPLSDPATLLTAETAAELRELIRTDYLHNDRRHLREP